jgi:hypothetical protein
MFAASFTICIRRTAHRPRKKRWIVSGNYTGSRKRFGDGRPRSEERFVRRGRGRFSIHCSFG